MKKFLFFIILPAFLMPDAFSRNESGETGIRFETRKKKGYFNTTQIGMLMGNRPANVQNQGYYETRTDFQMSPSVTMTNGHIFNEHWMAGLGVGFEIFDRNLFPFFADIRYTLWDGNVSPFFAFKMGYAFSNFGKKHYENLTLQHEPYYVSNADLKKNGGLMLYPEMGVKVPLSENADLLFTVAYRYQKTKSTISQDFGQHYKWEHKESLNRLSFGVAIMFR